MSGQHLSRGLLRALLRGDRKAEDVAEELLHHLLEACPACRSAFERVQAELCDSKEYREVYRRVTGGIAVRRVEVTRLRQEAERDLADLLALPPEDRGPRIQRALKRFASPLLVDRLIESYRARLGDEPFEALALADLAREVALRLPHPVFGEPWCMSCLARASAHRGNALRAIGRLREAEPLLEAAYALFRHHGNSDPMTEAELLSLLASLRSDQRRFEEAESLIDSAVDLYRQLGDAHLAGKMLLKKGILCRAVGEAEGALEAATEAVACIDRERDAHLNLCAEHNVADYLAELGCFREARQRVLGNIALYRQFPDPWTQLRLHWLEARIAFGLQERQAAIATFEYVRQGFLDQGLPFQAALAGLELALVYIEQGQTAKVRHLAAEMVPVFREQEIEREALAAVLLFDRAARREKVTAEMVAQLLTHLRLARTRPHGTAV